MLVDGILRGGGGQLVEPVRGREGDLAAACAAARSGSGHGRGGGRRGEEGFAKRKRLLPWGEAW